MIFAWTLLYDMNYFIWISFLGAIHSLKYNSPFLEVISIVELSWNSLFKYLNEDTKRKVCDQNDITISDCPDSNTLTQIEYHNKSFYDSLPSDDKNYCVIENIEIFFVDIDGNKELMLEGLRDYVFAIPGKIDISIEIQEYFKINGYNFEDEEEDDDW